MLFWYLHIPVEFHLNNNVPDGLFGYIVILDSCAKQPQPRSLVKRMCMKVKVLILSCCTFLEYSHNRFVLTYSPKLGGATH